MSESQNGAGAGTLLPDASAPEITDLRTAPAAPPHPPPQRGHSPTTRRLIAGGAAVVVATGALAAALLGSSAHHAVSAPRSLTPVQVAAQDKPATLMVVAYGDPSSPLVHLGGGSTILDSGSAWVYDARQGLIVTNAHVVADASTIKVGFNQSTLTEATVAGVDLKHDIAVLKVPAGQLTGLRTLPRANPASVQQGDTAYALGFEGDGNSNFLNAPFQLTTGSVSALSGVSITVNADPLDEPNGNAGLFESDLIQTDAAINPGNSGGPLVNNHGELIGMNSAATQAAHTQGYAISIGQLDTIVPQLAQGRSNDWAGFGVIPMPPDLASKWGVPGGLLVASVTAGTPADQAGMTKLLGDATNAGVWMVIYKINGQDVNNEQEYVNALSQLQSGESFTVNLVMVDPRGNPVPGTDGTETLTAP